MERPLVLARGTSRWVLHPPVDPHDDLAAFFHGLADDWRGWAGSCLWDALEHEMTVEASHDGRGHVALAVTLRRRSRSYATDAWTARVVLTVEAGEELGALARDIERLTAPPERRRPMR